MNNINVLDEKVILVNEDTNLVFSNSSNYYVKVSASNLNITVMDNANVFLTIYASGDTNILVNVSNYANLTYNHIIFNNQNKIDFNAKLQTASSLIVNNLVLMKDKLTVNQNIDHLGRESYSKVDNIAIGFDSSNITFVTAGHIGNGIKNCNVNQLTRGIILSDNSVVSSTPILLIDEYDTKAYHGATIGKINDDDLFYLMSRGLTKDEAFFLVINGLIAPFLSSISDEDIKSEINDLYLSFFKE